MLPYLKSGKISNTVMYGAPNALQTVHSVWFFRPVRVPLVLVTWIQAYRTPVSVTKELHVIRYEISCFGASPLFGYLPIVFLLRLFLLLLTRP